MASHTATSDSLINRTLAHYCITEKIGAGGMGEVYRGHDNHLYREVAIKVLPSGAFTDERARKRFRQEALTLSKLNHPNIATIYDFDTQAGVDFLVMEYIPGTTLSEKLAARPLPEKEVIRLGTQSGGRLIGGARARSGPSRFEAGEPATDAGWVAEDSGFRAGEAAAAGEGHGGDGEPE